MVLRRDIAKFREKQAITWLLVTRQAPITGITRDIALIIARHIYDGFMPGMDIRGVDLTHLVFPPFASFNNHGNQTFPQNPNV